MATRSGTTTPATGSHPLNQPPDATVSLPLTESQARKIGLLARWQIARKKILTRQQRRSDAAARLQSAVQTLLTHSQSQSEPWSQRRLAKEIKLSWPTWLRCRRGKVNPRRWLPKLESALARLNAA